MLFFLGGFEAFHVERDAGVAGGVDHEIERHAEGFVESRSSFAPERNVSSFIWRRPSCKRAGELLFFREDDLGDAVGGVLQFGVGGPHLVADGEDHFVHEGLFLAEQTAVADAAAHDLAQDIAAAFVRGKDAVGDEERGARAWSAMMRREAAPFSSESASTSTTLACAE